MAKLVNPFIPNQPIDPDYFGGRLEEVNKVTSALNQTRHGKTQNILIAGERGIGKTSLAFFARHAAENPNFIRDSDFRFATAYYTIERGQTLEDVCAGLTSKLLEKIDTGLASACIEKLKSLKLHFGVHVPGIGEIKVDPSSEGKEKTRLFADFEKAVEEAWDTVKDTHNGILFVIDELHNLSSFDGVGSFFKVVTESWAADGYRNAMFLVIGLPHIPAQISLDDLSAPRVFSFVELKRMTQEESVAILNRCLASSDKKIDNSSLATIAKWAGGFPYFLHQLGYDAFDVDSDGVIDVDDVASGLIKSLTHFERMSFGQMYKSVEGKQKQKIVDALAETFDKPKTAMELQKKLSIKNIHQYLKPLEKDGIVELVDKRYRLSSELLSIYVRLFKNIPRQTAQKAKAAPDVPTTPSKGEPGEE
jgi:AAA ATPase domain